MAAKDINGGKTKRAIGAKAIAEAMGADETCVKTDIGGSPLSMFAMRQIIVEKLQSSGGRPKLQGAEKIRRKISVFENDWKEMEKLRERYKENEGINVSPSQIAAILIHDGLSRMGADKYAVEKARHKAKSKKSAAV